LAQQMAWTLQPKQLMPEFGARLFPGLRKHQRLATWAAVLLTLAVLSLTWLHGRHAAAFVAYPHDIAQASFAAAGDVIPHQAVRSAAAAAGPGVQGWSALFSDVTDVFQSADFGFVNMETPVAPAHSHGSKPFMFDAPLALPEALKANGIKIVSFANNHVMDQGWAGFAETRQHLREIGLQFPGTGDTAQQAWQPVIVQANGIKVGFLGITRWLNGNRNPDDPSQPHVNFFPYPDSSAESAGPSHPDPATKDEAGVIQAVQQARTQCDFLVVSIHWGIEYAPAPRPQDVELAHKIMEAGASVILGHHPHVLQPIETYRTSDGRNTVIFYSLGNFLSNQSRTYVDGLMPDKQGDPRDSMIVLFSAVKKDYGPAGTRIELGHVGILPVWGENNRNDLASGKAKTPVIHPVLIDREIPLVQARLDQLNKLPQPLTGDQKQEFIAVTTRLKLLDDRRQQILARTGDEYVTTPPKLSVKP